jgi:hypothetical protein
MNPDRSRDGTAPQNTTESRGRNLAVEPKTPRRLPRSGKRVVHHFDPREAGGAEGEDLLSMYAPTGINDKLKFVYERFLGTPAPNFSWLTVAEEIKHALQWAEPPSEADRRVFDLDMLLRLREAEEHCVDAQVSRLSAANACITGLGKLLESPLASDSHKRRAAAICSRLLFPVAAPPTSQILRARREFWRDQVVPSITRKAVVPVLEGSPNDKFRVVLELGSDPPSRSRQQQPPPLIPVDAEEGALLLRQQQVLEPPAPAVGASKLSSRGTEVGKKRPSNSNMFQPKNLQDLIGDKGPAKSVAAHPFKQTWFAVGTQKGHVVVVDSESGLLSDRLKIVVEDSIEDLRWELPQGRAIFVLLGNGSVLRLEITPEGFTVVQRTSAGGFSQIEHEPWQESIILAASEARREIEVLDGRTLDGKTSIHLSSHTNAKNFALCPSGSQTDCLLLLTLKHKGEYMKAYCLRPSHAASRLKIEHDRALDFRASQLGGSIRFVKPLSPTTILMQRQDGCMFLVDRRIENRWAVLRHFSELCVPLEPDEHALVVPLTDKSGKIAFLARSHKGGLTTQAIPHFSERPTIDRAELAECRKTKQKNSAEVFCEIAGAQDFRRGAGCMTATGTCCILLPANETGPVLIQGENPRRATVEPPRSGKPKADLSVIRTAPVRIDGDKLRQTSLQPLRTDGPKVARHPMRDVNEIVWSSAFVRDTSGEITPGGLHLVLATETSILGGAMWEVQTIRCPMREILKLSSLDEPKTPSSSTLFWRGSTTKTGPGSESTHSTTFTPGDRRLAPTPVGNFVSFVGDKNTGIKIFRCLSGDFQEVAATNSISLPRSTRAMAFCSSDLSDCAVSIPRNDGGSRVDIVRELREVLASVDTSEDICDLVWDSGLVCGSTNYGKVLCWTFEQPATEDSVKVEGKNRTTADPVIELHSVVVSPVNLGELRALGVWPMESTDGGGTQKVCVAWAGRISVLQLVAGGAKPIETFSWIPPQHSTITCATRLKISEEKSVIFAALSSGHLIELADTSGSTEYSVKQTIDSTYCGSVVNISASFWRGKEVVFCAGATGRCELLVLDEGSVDV